VSCYAKTSTAKSGDETWRPPPTDVVKFNIDGAFVDGHSKGRWGVVARTSGDVVVAARAGCSIAIHDAFLAEL
jgi:hypothetical protein